MIDKIDEKIIKLLAKNGRIKLSDIAKEINLSIPLVVRLAGTNFEEGKKILEQSKLKILSASDLNDAAKKIVEAIK